MQYRTILFVRNLVYLVDRTYALLSFLDVHLCFIVCRKILKYTDPTKALAETDLDRIQKKVSEEVAKDSVDLEMSEQTAAQLSFTLPASSYATMALRELMKISTSVSHVSSSQSPNNKPSICA